LDKGQKKEEFAFRKQYVIDRYLTYKKKAYWLKMVVALVNRHQHVRKGFYNTKELREIKMFRFSQAFIGGRIAVVRKY
jgi:hypothetical protein